MCISSFWIIAFAVAKYYDLLWSVLFGPGFFVYLGILLVVLAFLIEYYRYYKKHSVDNNSNSAVDQQK
jgi:uncharacterized membrane protein